MQRRPRTGIPWLRRRKVPYGTVYLMQARATPRLFKVGFTKRRTKDRRTELNRVASDDLAIVYTVSLPWARACETLIFRRLRRCLSHGLCLRVDFGFFGFLFVSHHQNSSPPSRAASASAFTRP